LFNLHAAYQGLFQKNLFAKMTGIGRKEDVGGMI